MSTYDQPAYGEALTRDQTRAVFGQVMGLVALTVGFAALGAYIGRNFTGGTGFLFFIGAFACVFGLNVANSRGHEQLAIALLFGLGLLLGLAVAPVHRLLRARPIPRRCGRPPARPRVRRRARRLRLRHASRPVGSWPGSSSGRCWR